MNALLSVRHLTTVFDLPQGPAAAVYDVSFDINRGETLCLVGESGSGKSMTALSILRLVPSPGRIADGEVLFEGCDLLRASEHEMERIRGARIGLVFQEPMSALSPVFSVGEQIVETLLVHKRASSREQAYKLALDLLAQVSVPQPAERMRDYPYQLSGGLRQRVMIALAIACSPSLVIADEPTTALDVTIQAEILELLRDMRKKLGIALLLITHDLGVVAETADRVAVMYAGRIVEEAPVRSLLQDPKHPYTRALLASIPGGIPGTKLEAIPGSVPALGTIPAGCPFTLRCPSRFEPCPIDTPALVDVGIGRRVRCFLHSRAAEPRPEPDEIAHTGAVD